MRAAGFGLMLGALSFVAACGHSPAAPSTTGSAISQAAVASIVTQGLSQGALLAPTFGDVPNTFTFPCAGGGSITSTVAGTLPRDPGMVLTTSVRTDFHDCRSGTTTINGDPYLESSSEHVFSGPGVSGNSTSTIHTTGGVRFDTNGVQGRAQFNCTMTVAANASTVPVQLSVAWSGTMTFEQPLGTVTTRPCGPA